MPVCFLLLRTASRDITSSDPSLPLPPLPSPILTQYPRPGQTKRDAEALRSSPVIGSVGVEQRVGGFPNSTPYQTVYPSLLGTDTRRTYHHGLTTTANSHRFLDSYQPKTSARPRVEPASNFPGQRETLSKASQNNSKALNVKAFKSQEQKTVYSH